MRKTGLALLTISAAAVAMGGVAFSQAPASSAGALSAEDQSAAPFPAGRYAAVVKTVCTECHTGKVITDRRFTKDEAENFYKNMVGGDVTTEQAKQILEYLTTTLGA